MLRDGVPSHDTPGCSHAVAERVRAARERQALRYAGEPFATNSELPAAALPRHCALDDESYTAYGARTGSHAAAVKSRAYRARRRLACLLREERADAVAP